jgi:hypothetical protein
MYIKYHPNTLGIFLELLYVNGGSAWQAGNNLCCWTVMIQRTDHNLDLVRVFLYEFCDATTHSRNIHPMGVTLHKVGPQMSQRKAYTSRS